MKKVLLLFLLTLATIGAWASKHDVINAWLDRIGGAGTHKRILTQLVESDGEEEFTITSNYWIGSRLEAFPHAALWIYGGCGRGLRTRSCLHGLVGHEQPGRLGR